MATTETQDAKSVDVSLNVLELLNRERTTFGLRSTTTGTSNTATSLSSTGGEKDYDRYRQHCSNKIHRLRQVTGAGCGDAKKGFKGVKKVELGDVRDVKPLQLLLFLSERSHAHSQSLLAQLTRSKSASSNKSTNEPINDIGSRALKREQLSKLRRAVGYAEELDALVKAIAEGSNPTVTISVQTRLEILTHLLHLRSLLSFHRSSYESSLPISCLRSHILSLLASPTNCSSSYAQALYSEEMDSGEPLLRFAAYKLGRRETHDVQGIVDEFGAVEGAWEEVYEGYGALMAAYEKEVQGRDDRSTAMNGKNAGKRGTLRPITWADETVEIRNAGVVDAMVRAQSAIEALESVNIGNNDSNNNKKGTEHSTKTGTGPVAKRSYHHVGANVKVMNKWDAVLAALGEAEAVARRAAEEDQNNTSARRAAGSTSQSSPTFVHQYISHLLLSYRIRRDLLLTSTLGDPLRRTTASTLVLKPSATSTKSKPQTMRTTTSMSSSSTRSYQPYGKQPLTRAKKAEALKTLNALVKLYDSVLQGMGQIRELGVVEERDGVRRASEGMEAYFKAVRCVKLSQMYLLLPAAEYSSAVHLASRATAYASDARASLGLGIDSDDANESTTLLELFHPISAQDDLDPLERQARDLEAVTKRALYAEVKGRPLFYDTAFNYIDLPMEELEVAAGRTPAPSADDVPTTSTSTPKGLVSTLASVVSDPVHAIEGVVGTAKKTVTPESRGRESTPGPGGEGEEASAEENKSKGWFGGLWGGRK